MASTFVYTLVPSADEDAIRELRMAVPESLEENIGCLTKALQDHYRRVAPIEGEAGKQAVMTSVREQLQRNNPDAGAPDESMLGMLAQSQTVDIVQLLPATAATGFFGVNMYVDDKGQSKGSPINARASAICAACGLPTEVRGDAFVAKLWDDQDGFERHDLRTSDLASDAPWVLEAKQRNEARSDPAAAARQLSALSNGGAGAQVPTEPLGQRLSQATAAKASGNERFREADVDGAAVQYDGALKLLGSSSGIEADAEATDAEKTASAELLLVCWVNLAACRLRQGQPYAAIEACDAAIAVDDGAGKAWYRRGQACMALEQYGVARKNLARAATLLPSSREVRDEHSRCLELLAQKRATGFEL